MKYISILGAVSAFTQSNEIKGMINKFRFSSINQHIYTDPLKKEVQHVLSPGGKFKFEVGSLEPKEKTEDFIAALQVAAGFWGNTFSFKSQFKVHVNFGKYRGNGGEIQTDSMMLSKGGCDPNFQYRKDSSGTWIAWPNALIKETENIQLGDQFDMKIWFNKPYPSMYGKNRPVEDIADVIFHESVHGLGMEALLYSNLEGNVTYGPTIDVEKTHSHFNYKFNMSYYDTFLYTEKDSIYNILRPGSIQRSHSLECSDLKHHLKAIKPFQKIKELAVTPMSTYFKTKDSNKLYVFTTKDFPGTVFSHFAFDYKVDQNFLFSMLGTEYGMSARVAYNKEWNTTSFGSYIIQMMQTLGYTLNPSPKREKSQLALFEVVAKHVPSKCNFPVENSLLRLV